jgi:hypothetical protein
MATSAIFGRRMVRLGSAGEPTSSKYRNKPTVVDGIRFDSKKEAARWKELCLLQTAGQIRELRRQVTYELKVEGKLIARYKADFQFDELRSNAWALVVEDVKGQTDSTAYRLFKLKAKLMEALFKIEVREV